MTEQHSGEVRRSLRRKLVLPLLALVVGIAGLTVWMIGSAVRNQLESKLTDQAQLLANAVNYSAESIRNIDSLQRIVSALGADKNVDLIVVVGGNPLRVLASNRNVLRNKLLTELPTPFMAEDLETAIRTRSPLHSYHPALEVFDYTSPLRLSQQSLMKDQITDGAVMVHLEAISTIKAIRQTTLTLSGAFLMLLALLAGISYLVLDRLVLRPLSSIGERVQRQASTENSWPEVSGNDEIALLARRLHDSLSRSDAVLRAQLELQETLEASVRERTIELQHSNARLDFLLSTSPVTIYASAPEPPYGATFISANLVDTLGYTAEEFVNLADFWSDHIHPQDRERVFAELADVFVRGTHRNEYRFRHKDGEWRWLEDVLRVVHDGDGKPKELLGYITDITPRKQLDQVLQQAVEHIRISESRFRTMADSAPVGIFRTTQANDNVIYVNTEYCRICGVSMDELLGAGWAKVIHPDDRELVFSKWSQAKATLSLFAEEYRLQHTDGSVAWVLGRAHPEIGSDGELLGHVGTLTDITDHKLAEMRLSDLLHEKEVLLREVHHRVKNNLQIISSLLHFQSKKAEDDSERTVFSEAQERLRSMILVHDLLYRSRDLHRIDLADYLRALSEQLQRSFDDSAARVRIQTELESVLVPVEIALPCGMIATELVTNVFKYAYGAGEEGELRLRLYRTDDHFVLEVADDGPGLPEGIDLASADSFGLRLVRSLSRQVGGDVRILNVAGTTWAMRIPLAQADTATDNTTNTTAEEEKA